MKLIEKNIELELNEEFLIETLNLNCKKILELGCGDASKTIKIATNGFDREVIACEVDTVQHEKNIKLEIDNLKFELCGAENLPFEDSTFHNVFLFKSFHHIPLELMDKALSEIKRVLKPNGLVYISEPLFDGELNEIISIFHDEKVVREKAFEAIKKAVDDEEFKLFREVFFYSLVTYESFEDFKSKVMDVTFHDKTHSEELIKKVKNRFNQISNNQEITFKKPFRVDILQKF